MTDPVKVSEWPTPTKATAEFYASAVEAGIIGAIAIQSLFPEIPVERAGALAEKWERTREVRAARFDVRSWLERDTGSRIDFALSKSRNQMAAFLATANLAEAKDATLTKALKFIEILEKVVAGTAGKSDPAAQFFAEFLKKQKAGKKDAEVVQ